MKPAFVAWQKNCSDFYWIFPCVLDEDCLGRILLLPAEQNPLHLARGTRRQLRQTGRVGMSVKPTLNNVQHLITKLQSKPWTPYSPSQKKKNKRKKNPNHTQDTRCTWFTIFFSSWYMASLLNILSSSWFACLLWYVMYTLNVTPLSLNAADYTPILMARCMQSTSSKWLLAHHFSPLSPLGSVIPLYYIYHCLC